MLNQFINYITVSRKPYQSSNEVLDKKFSDYWAWIDEDTIAVNHTGASWGSKEFYDNYMRYSVFKHPDKIILVAQIID